MTRRPISAGNAATYVSIMLGAATLMLWAEYGARAARAWGLL